MNCKITQFLMGCTEMKRLSPSHYGEKGILKKETKARIELRGQIKYM